MTEKLEWLARDKHKNLYPVGRIIVPASWTFVQAASKVKELKSEWRAAFPAASEEEFLDWLDANTIFKKEVPSPYYKPAQARK